MLTACLVAIFNALYPIAYLNQELLIFTNLINHLTIKHEKTRLNRADVLFVEFSCDDYGFTSQVKGQAA